MRTVGTLDIGGKTLSVVDGLREDDVKLMKAIGQVSRLKEKINALAKEADQALEELLALCKTSPEEEKPSGKKSGGSVKVREPKKPANGSNCGATTKIPFSAVVAAASETGEFKVKDMAAALYKQGLILTNSSEDNRLQRYLCGWKREGFLAKVSYGVIRVTAKGIKLSGKASNPKLIPSKSIRSSKGAPEKKAIEANCKMGLLDYSVLVLSENPDGMKTSDLLAEVQKSGAAIRSSNPKNAFSVAIAPACNHGFIDIKDGKRVLTPAGRARAKELKSQKSQKRQGKGADDKDSDGKGNESEVEKKNPVTSLPPPPPPPPPPPELPPQPPRGPEEKKPEPRSVVRSTSLGRDTVIGSKDSNSNLGEASPVNFKGAKQFVPDPVDKAILIWLESEGIPFAPYLWRIDNHFMGWDCSGRHALLKMYFERHGSLPKERMPMPLKPCMFHNNGSRCEWDPQKGVLQLWVLRFAEENGFLPQHEALVKYHPD